MSTNYYESSLIEHKKYAGKVQVSSRVPLETRDDMSTYYSPGVAQPCLEIAKNDPLLHNVVSVITAGNEGSTKLHARFGFTYCGLTPQVGFKHGKYQDTETYALLV